MSRPQTQPTIPDIRLERYRLGELPPAEHQAIADRLVGDEALRERLALLERSDRETIERHPTGEMAAAIRRRGAALETEKRWNAAGRRRAWLVPATAVAACACVMAVAASLWVGQPVPEDTTIKGGGAPSLVIHRRVGEGSEELKRGAVARQGDEIRIGYRASGHSYGAILSIDGRGNLTQHLPRTGEQAVPLEPSGTVLLDFAYELDDAPRWEAFYFVASEAPFDLEPVRQAMRQAAGPGQRSPAALRLPRGLVQFLFPLSKDRR